jgi:S-adenosylmethionine uptake transporter
MQYSQIIWANLYSFLLFNETVDEMVVLGSVLIIASGMFVVWRESRSNVSEKTPVLRNPNPRFGGGAVLRDDCRSDSARKKPPSPE